MSGYLRRGEKLLHQAALVDAEGVEFARLRGDAGIEDGEARGDLLLLGWFRKIDIKTLELFGTESPCAVPRDVNHA